MTRLHNASQIVAASKDEDLQRIGIKILNKERISFDDGVILFQSGSLSYFVINSIPFNWLAFYLFY